MLVKMAECGWCNLLWMIGRTNANAEQRGPLQIDLPIFIASNRGQMEFRLTYDGALYAKPNARHIHDIRQRFHKQLRELWTKHPVLIAIEQQSPQIVQAMDSHGFTWRPLVTESNGMICKLDILMLRDGPPGRVIADIDNRLKTLFDALRMAHLPQELGERPGAVLFKPDPEENPFYVLVRDDRLITHISVTTDTMLEPVPNIPRDNAVRLMISVTVRPYHTNTSNLDYI